MEDVRSKSYVSEISISSLEVQTFLQVVIKTMSKGTQTERMPKEQRFADLEEHIKDQEEFRKKGFERIKKYYSLPEDKREEQTRLDIPPPEILMKRASDLILLGLERLRKEEYLTDEPSSYILIGIGTEILSKAIILKQDPTYFIEKIKDRTTLPFKKCCEKLKEFLPKTSTQKQRRRIDGVLELIRLKRNNLVHLGFHQMKHPGEDYQIANVLEFLFSHFFREKTEEIVGKLSEFKEERKAVPGKNYEHVDFSA